MVPAYPEHHSKGHASLSFLERNLRCVPQQLRERAFFTIVRPALEYASAITDPYLKEDISKLDKVQRHAARFVTNNPRRKFNPDQDQISVTGLLRDLHWESLASRRQDARCTLMYKVLNGLVKVDDDLRPSYSDSRFRSGQRLDLMRISTSAKACEPYHHSFYPRTVRDWNLDVPIPARKAKDLTGFKAALHL